MVTVIIISYNSGAVITKCLDALISSNQYPVIIVDNASTDDSVIHLKSHYPSANVIAEPKNLGYGRAANVGLNIANTPYTLLVNPDLELGPNQLGALLDRAKQLNHDFTVLAPAIKESDFKRTGVVDAQWVIGAAMLFNMEKLNSIGFFDDNFFLFYEEKDLCKRAKDNGERVLLDTNIFVKHLKGLSTEPNLTIEHLKNWHVGWSSMYYFNKHEMLEGKRKPWRMMLECAFRATFSKAGHKRQKFRSRLGGMCSFCRGEKAFDLTGKPRQLP
mgnify:CR=1 FL=1